MNFGRWIKSCLFRFPRTNQWFLDSTGFSNSSVNRWVSGQLPRVDTFVISCEVIAKEEGRCLDDVIFEALLTIDAYRCAKSRQSKSVVND
jgi:hypothetical protein|tara:strand:+ start:2022 stop:2291 length:270 start_codon:yes stop_codon:yes gene_type:complete